jgi:hypothetical protein
MRMVVPKNANETMRMPPREVTDTRKAGPGAETLTAPPGGPLELPPGSWEAPPVRLPGTAPGPEPSVGPGLPAADREGRPSRAERARRRARWIIIGLAAAAGVFIGVGAWVVRNATGKAEDTRLEEARRQYQGQNFLEAATAFRALAKEYPSSPHLHTYKFYGALSEARLPAYQLPDSPKATRSAYRRWLRFLEDHEGDELFQEVRGDVQDTFYEFTRQLADWAKKKQSRKLLDLARRAFDQGGKYGEGTDKAVQVKALIDQLAKADQTRERRRGLLALLDALAANPSAATLRRARELAREAGKENDPEIARRLQKLAAAHRAVVVYVPARELRARRRSVADTETSLLVAPSAGRGAGINAWSRKSPVLALARGVLYALRPRTGAVIWARRVGIDTTVLPVRIPRYKATPETVLALSSDTATLSAVDAFTGKSRWDCPLSAPCLGRPTVVTRPAWGGPDRIYVPCYNGRVDEIDAGSGKLLGQFRLGRDEHVSLGGAFDEDSGLLYVAADSYCVYILDLARRKCRGVLYTGHPSGSLRCAPVILRRKDVPVQARPNPASPRSCLVLSQADGLGATELRLYALPVTRPRAAPLALKVRLKGWSWFPPREDSEKLAVATDQGVLGVYGIKQKDNRDDLLYPILGGFPPGGYVLEGAEKAGPDDLSGRAELVHLDESNFWVLARGRLHRLQFALGIDGWKMTELWENPLPLGSPLHEAQVATGRNILFLVTRAGAGQTCLASAVEAEAEADDTSKVKWQRQLGLVCREAVVAAPGTVLVQDHRGGLFRFDASAYPNDHRWHIVHEHSLADPPGDETGRALKLLLFRGGAYALTVLGSGSPAKLVVRRFDPVAAGKGAPVTEHSCDLKAPIAGTPGAWPDQLVLPLVGGTLMRLRVPGGVPEDGLDWRADGADAGAVGHVVPLDAGEFLVTDGSRGLVWMTWPKGGNCKEKTRLTLPARVVAPPLVLGGPRDATFRILVADADGRVTLLRGDRKRKELEVVRGQHLGGKISDGPFRLGKDRVGCVVEGRRLVVLDARDNEPAWAYPSARKPAPADFVGRPVVAGRMVVVTDVGGRFIGLDLATGRPRGPGYKLRAQAAPTCAPVAFGPDRLFAPLTDGTTLLLSLKRLQATSRSAGGWPFN